MSRREDEIIQQAMHQVDQRRQRRRGMASLRWTVAWWVVVLTAFFLSPWPLQTKTWAAVHGLCAQVTGHMLTFGGHELALCARDSGLYVGALLGTIYLLVRRRWRAGGWPARWFWVFLIAVVALFAVDVLNSVAEDWFGSQFLYPPHNALRLITGLLLGLATSVPLLWVINLAFSNRQRERAILAHGGDLAGLLLVGAAGGLLLWSGWAPLFIPMTVLAVGGMMAMLLAANALWILTATRGKALLDSYWEITPPIWWGSVATVLELALLSWLRYRIGQ